MKMKKCFGKTRAVVQFLLILWMTSLIHIAVGDSFHCSGSNMNVSVMLVCDGYYDCDNYEDESLCNKSAAYLQEGESHFISLPYTPTTRLYNATLLQTNATNGFQVVFQSLYLYIRDVKVEIGTGNDPSDIQSVVTTITGYRNTAPDDVYVYTNEMWIAAIGAKSNSRLIMGAEIISIDLSTVFACSSSNMNVSRTVVCDGLYQCDRYEDELACDNSAAFLQEGDSHFISLPFTSTARMYNATLLQTNATNGFQVLFYYLSLVVRDDKVEIGTGNNPSDIQSIITTFYGYRTTLPDDVYVDANEMWIAAIGAKSNSRLQMDVWIISNGLSTVFACSSSNRNVSRTVVCDGLYQCDRYEDELACDKAAAFLQEGESHFISLPSTTTTRLYTATFLQTNATNGFQVVFHYLYLRTHDVKVEIGTGNDPSDIQSVITTFYGYRTILPDDVYVDANEMWIAAIGAKIYSKLRMDVEIISIDLSTVFACSSSNRNVSRIFVCDGLYQCDRYEDELACDNSAAFLQEGDSHFISLPSTTTTRLYNATLLQTNSTNGFQVVFLSWYLHNPDVKVEIGTGNDPTDIQSVITTFYGFGTSLPDDVYVGTNEMWFAAIGGESNSKLRMDVEIISIDSSTVFACSSSNKNVPRTVVCDGLYQCERYEDELACDNSAAFLQEGDSHFISLPYTTTTRLYNATLLQTNATNGFQVVFHYLYLHTRDVKVEIGTGHDPSDIQSVITTITGYRNTVLDDVYVDANEMWFAAIGAKIYSSLKMDVWIFSKDLSTVFACSSSNRNVSRTVVCDGLYQCDRYEDELACDNSAAFLQEGNSHFISLPYTTTTRLYNATLLQTNATNGFQIVFLSWYLHNRDDKVEIGTGHDPSDIQSVITTFYGYRTLLPDYVQVYTNEMWFAAIGAKSNSGLQMDVEIISIDLSTVFACSSSNMNVSRTLVCDGRYQCDRYEDELACDNSAAFLQEGESHFISLPSTTTIRLYNATLLQTNATNGFQVVFQSLYLDDRGVTVEIGTGNDPSNIQSVITTFFGYRITPRTILPDDVYVYTNEMWFAAIGAKSNTRLQMDVEIFSIDLSTVFACSSSNMNVSRTVVCDGLHQCDRYEDELACDNSAAFLQEGESHFISLPSTTTTRLYNATLLQTNATNGFQVVFQSLYLYSHVKVEIGTGNDPSDMQSVVTAITGFRNTAPDDVYVDTNQMWFAVVGAKSYSRLQMDAEIISIDLSTVFACSSSNMNVSRTVVCDGLYQCDRYEDELACDKSAAYLQEGESHFISLPSTTTTRLYDATLLQTNAMNGFQVVFHYLYLYSRDVKVEIGTGNDPSDIQSVVTTITGYRNIAPDDVYVYTNEMWIAAIGAKSNSRLQMDAEIISIDLSTVFACSSSNMNVSRTAVCDGLYQCDRYEDELACDNSTAYLQEGESHFIYLRSTATERLYNATLLQTNATNGFQVVFHYLYLQTRDVKVEIGTGNDPSDIQSVVTTSITDYRNTAPDDVYVYTDEMWIAAIGGESNSQLLMDVEIISIDLSTVFACSSSNMNVSRTIVCDGRYQCDRYEDELECAKSAFLQEGESYFISLPSTTTRRLYNATLLQTNATNGFQVVFRYLYLRNRDVKVEIGTGNDPSDIQSVITLITGYRTPLLDDVYVDTNQIWFAAIGAKGHSRLQMDVEIISIDLSTVFACSSSNMNVSRTLVCDGRYQCDRYEDELACDNSAAYLQEGESHFISLPSTTTTRLYDATLLQTNATNGFQVVFHYLYLHNRDVKVEIGTGNDPSDIQSVITIITGYRNTVLDDVYVDTNQMWFAAIGAKSNSMLQMDVEIISIDLSTVFACSSSNMNVSRTVVCDGRYQCDRYEDELACDKSAAYLQEGESHFISLPSTTTTRLFNATLLQTNATNGFQVVFHYLYLHNRDVKVEIGTGNDPSDIQSVITIITGYRNTVLDDVYVDTNQMWFAAIGAKSNSRLQMDVWIFSNGLSTICQSISWISPRFERVEFPVGEYGTWANSTGICPFNTTQVKEPIGRALCIGDGITQSQWQPVDNCGPFRNVTDILTEIAEVIVGEENAGEVSQQVSSVTSNIEDITSDDITFVAEITSNIVQQNLTSEEVTEAITSIVSNIAEVEREELEAAEEEGGAISKLVQAFEEQISRAEVADGGMLNIQQPNVAVQVQSVLADDVMSGLVLSLAGSSLSDLTKSNITIRALTQDDRDDVIATRPDIIAQVNIPPSVSSVISSTAPFSGSPSNGSGEYIRVNFNVFSTPALFISKSLRTISANNEGFNRSANSPVISLSIGQGKVTALTEFINFTFTTIMSGYVNPMCSFWDEEQEDWSQDGCVLVSGITSSDERYDEESVRCACDHLTNFAVIMDIHRHEGSLITAYNSLTYIGCCISIFSLLVTLTTYLWNKDLRTGQPNQILICLCLTLLCLYTTFVIMISLDSIRDYREVQAGPCGFLTALVHYFVLSSIAWMGVDGYNMYLLFVKIFNPYIQNFMIKAFLAAWGIPALIVVLTGAIARDYYAHDDLCFLQFWAQIGGLLIPMSIILLINIVIFILVVRRLCESSNTAGRVKREAKVERRETIKRVQNAICILLLLGLTWVTGYLLLIPLFSQVAQPIFIVLNSFQGLFIFLLYCVRNPDIRKKWGLTCFDKFLKKEASTSSGVMNSTAPSSSAGVISNLRPEPSANSLLPTKDDNPDPMCMFNPTFDVSQVEEGVTPPMNKDLQSSIEEQKKDTDRDATSINVVTV